MVLLIVFFTYNIDISSVLGYVDNIGSVSAEVRYVL